MAAEQYASRPVCGHKDYFTSSHGTGKRQAKMNRAIRNVCPLLAGASERS